MATLTRRLGNSSSFVPISLNPPAVRQRSFLPEVCPISWLVWGSVLDLLTDGTQMNSLRLQSQPSDLRTRFAQGVSGPPIHRRIAGMFDKAFSWLTPLSVEDPCLKGHKFDLKDWGPSNLCQECGELLMSTSQVRREPEQNSAPRIRLNPGANRVLH